MTLRFGIFDHLELLAQADRDGIYGYHIAEHHHSPLCLAPNQSVFLAAVAARTERLRFGPLVYVLPLHNPIRLIEEISMVDQLSGGRFQVGVGRGTGGGTEFAMWGGDPAENDDRYEETLRIVVQGLQSEFLSFQGKHFQYQDLWMELRPKQTPHPPFWYAGNAEHAAEGGMNFIGTGRIARFAETAARYREVWEQRQQSGDPGVLPLADPLYGAMKHMYIADSDEEAVERARSAYDVYGPTTRSRCPRRRSRLSGPGGRSTSEAWNEAAERAVRLRDQANDPSRGPASIDFDRAFGGEALIAGSPATVREYLERYAAGSGANYYVGAFQWGDLTHAEASHSLKLFTSEVMPAVS